jgi:hypothetical protein
MPQVEAKLCASGICQTTLSCAVGGHVTGRMGRRGIVLVSRPKLRRRPLGGSAGSRIGVSISCPYERWIGRRHWRPAQCHVVNSSGHGLFGEIASVVDALLCPAEGAATASRKGPTSGPSGFASASSD